METRNVKPGAVDDTGIDPLIGRTFEGRYRIERPLGAGGLGAVYRADDNKLNREVALKVLLPDYVSSDELRKRFEREARALATLAHPNVVPVSDYGIDDDAPYLVMELLHGKTLGDLIEEEGQLPLERALSIVRQVLKALAFTHGRGLVHRDLKPANIFLQKLSEDAEDHVRILDFGLAKFVEREKDPHSQPLTRAGMAFGTPSYMAPEQASGDDTDERTDVYGVGIVLYEMLAGEKPFYGEPAELLKQHLLSPTPSLKGTREEPALDALDAVVQRATQKDPGKRYPSAAELLGAIDAVAQRRASSAAPPRSSNVDPAAATVRPGPVGPSLLADLPKPILLGAAGIGLLFLILIVLLISWAFGDDEQTPTAVEPAPDVSEELPSGVEPPIQPPGELSIAGLPPNPWGQGRVPPLLAQSRSTLESGRRLDETQIRSLTTFSRANPNDSRPLLLMARHYVARGWRSDGVDRYQRAYEANPGARGDPQMLADLLSLIPHGSVGGRAQRAIAQIYGREALPSVEAALRRDDLDANTRRRFERLRDELQN